MIKIYALWTEGFKTAEDFHDGSPTKEYFYVGHTGDLHKRKIQHASLARNKSPYPYYEKIRKLGDNWYIEELDCVPDDEKSDHEEFYIIKLTVEGHPLLNIKRGDKLNKCQQVFSELSKAGVKSSTDYTKLKTINHQAKIAKREQRQIENALVFLGHDKSGKDTKWRLGENEFTADRYVNKKEIAELIRPSTTSKFDEIFAKIKSLMKGKL